MDWGNFLTSIFDGAVPVIFIGFIIWRYQHRIEKIDRKEQMHLDRRIKVEDELYNNIKTAKDSFIRFCICVSKKSTNEDINKEVNSMYIHLQQSYNLIECMPDGVLSKYKDSVFKLISDYRKFSSAVSEQLNNIDERINLMNNDFNLVLSVYYGVEYKDTYLISATKKVDATALFT